jgi:hypothetical protein
VVLTDWLVVVVAGGALVLTLVLVHPVLLQTFAFAF